ncbi:MAG: ankyrin repeat domain-containing protein [Vulcanimicrobiota bacterium]
MKKLSIFSLIAVLMLLVSCGLTINKTKYYKALEEGDLATVKEMVKEHPSLVNEKIGDSGQTALEFAIDNKRTEIALFLIENGASVNNRYYLHFAVMQEMKEVAGALIDKGVSVNTEDEHGRTPLHQAVDTSNLEMVKFLLYDKYADPNPRDEWTNTPLHYATLKSRKGEKHYDEIAEILRKARGTK